MFRIASACTSVRRELGHQHRLRLVLGADDRDHPVEVEVGDQQPVEHLQPGVDPLQPEARRGAAARRGGGRGRRAAPPCSEQTCGVRPSISTFMFIAKRVSRSLAAEQHLHQHRRVDGARARLQHDADVLGALVAHVGEDRDLLGVDQLGDALDQLALLHLVGDLGDDDLPRAAAEILDRPARAQPERAAAGAVGLLDRGARLDDDPAGREVRALHEVEQRLVARVRRLDQVQAGVAAARRGCAAGCWSPCRRRCPTSRSRAGSGTPPAAPPAPARSRRSCRGSRPRPRPAPPSARRRRRSAGPRCSAGRRGCRRRCCRSCPARRPAGSGR